MPYSVSPRLLLHDERREEQREPLDPHADRLRGDEVAELVQDDQRREAREREEPAQALTASRSTSAAAVRARLRVGVVEVVEAPHGHGLASPRACPRSRAAMSRKRERGRRGTRAPPPRWRRSARTARSRRRPPRRARARGTRKVSRSGGSKRQACPTSREVERSHRHVGALRDSAARRRSGRACPGGPGARARRRR